MMLPDVEKLEDSHKQAKAAKNEAPAPVLSHLPPAINSITFISVRIMLMNLKNCC